MAKNTTKPEAFDQLLESIQKPVKVGTPLGFKEKIKGKIEESKSSNNTGPEYIKWAALWLIVCCNAVAYYTYVQNVSTNNASIGFDDDASIELLVEDYYQEESLYEESLN